MSRSALWRQEANVKERQRQADETFQRVLEEGKLRSQRGLVKITNDTHFNLNPMLLQNITKSPYFQKCCNNLKDWSSLVDEIYYEVKSLEPWSNEATKTPSTAFCLLVRLLTMRCTTKEMENLIEHVDSPYIRCIGFLYLRYVCDPKELWDWFMPYLYDVEKVQVCEGNKRCGKGQGTVGDFVRSLLYDLEFFGTRLPRLPQGVEKEIKSKLMQEGEIENRAVGHEQDKRRMDYFQKVGNKVIAMYGDEENAVTWYDAVIDRVLWKDDETGYQFTRPKFIVTFAEYGNTEKVSLGEMDIPGGTSGRRGDHRGQRRSGHDNRYRNDSSYYSSNRDGRDRHRERSRSRDRNDSMINEVNCRGERDRGFARGGGNCSPRAHVSSFRQGMNNNALGSGGSGGSNREEYHHHQNRDTFNDRKYQSSREENEEGTGNSPKQTSPKESTVIKEKKRQLIAKYG